MNRLFTLIKKNFRLIVRSKASALMIILGPLLLIMLVGAAFNTANIYGIRVGVYSEEYSPLSEAIIHELNQGDYATQKVESEQACIEGVKNGIFHVCSVFPNNLKVDLGGNIQFYVDNTKTNIVYLISETISANIGKKSQDLSFQLTKGVVDTLEDIKDTIEDREDLLDEIKSLNEEDKVLLGIVSNDLAGMTLNYEKTDIPLGTLQSQISDSNSSAGSAFNAVESKIETILEDTSKASSKRDSSLEKIQTLSQNTESSKFSIAQMQKTFDSIKRDVSGVKETGVNKIVNPITSDIKPITTQKTHINFIFPTLMIMIIMFVSMLLTSTLEIREKTSRVYFKNFITPTSTTMFTLSNYLTNLIIIGIQSTILLGAASYFFFDSIATSIPLLLPALFIIISFFLFLGILLGNIFKTEETNTITNISLGFIMIFFSSAILPIETLPTVIRSIASFNPFFISETLLNKIILFQAPLKNVLEHFLLLSGYLIGIIIITLISKKITKRGQ
ncbi:ABC transporter permease [Candidatus Woesearchaeota archaeon]|nr:ABC transporter permease [Candidatus Woesearchaeota archaeon]MBT6402329.1 ABC transporter permease [Candidatus Woesearchaeota archaeon]